MGRGGGSRGRGGQRPPAIKKRPASKQQQQQRLPLGGGHRGSGTTLAEALMPRSRGGRGGKKRAGTWITPDVMDAHVAPVIDSIERFTILELELGDYIGPERQGMRAPRCAGLVMVDDITQRDYTGVSVRVHLGGIEDPRKVPWAARWRERAIVQ